MTTYAIQLTLRIVAETPEDAVKQLREQLSATRLEEIRIKPTKGGR